MPVRRAQPAAKPPAAVEVMTGAVLPPGTDVVVRYEDIVLENNRATIQIAPPAAPGVNIHRQAADRRAGDALLPPGTRLGPAELAVAATVGAAEMPRDAPPARGRGEHRRRAGGHCRNAAAAPDSALQRLRPASAVYPGRGRCVAFSPHR